jgi:signal peptidase II
MLFATPQTADNRLRSTLAFRLTDVRARFGVLAALAASVDLLTKALATGLLSDGRSMLFSDRLGLMLVYNTGGAGGLMIGPYTWALNIIVTLGAILMVTRIVAPLAAVDPRATLALSLVTGGAIGNLASMLAGPEGVADFLAVRIGDATTIVMNGADLLLWSGALMLVPVVARLVRAVRSERSA